MGLYKQCTCTNTDLCAHPWWGQSRGKRVSLQQWGRTQITTKADAKKMFVRLEAAVLEGTFHRGPSNDGYVIADLIHDYLKDYFLPKGREYEKKEKYRFRAIADKFGAVAPENLNLLDVERWVNELRRQGKGAGTIKRYIARLKAILTWGFNRERFPTLRVRWGALDLDPEGDGRARRLEDGEEVRLKVAATPYVGQLLDAALDTGLRAGTLLGLQFGMIDWHRGVVRVPRSLLKNKKATHDLEMPMSVRLKDILAERQRGPHGQPLPSEAFIFGTPWGRRKRNFQAAWNATRKAAGIPKDKNGQYTLHWHDLRGEFATRLHEAGVAIETISYLLDHSTIEMTRRYIKVRTRSAKPAEAIAALDRTRYSAFVIRES